MKNLLLIIFLFSSMLVFSQTYDLTVRQGVYEPLAKSISVTNGEVWDDPDYTIPIGFDFTFFDESIEQLYSNGLDINALFTEPEETYSTTPTSVFIPLFVDLIDLGYGSGESLSNISYLVQGQEGERICKVEWSNAGFFENMDSGSETDFVNFQLWLYENSGTIEVHFGDSEIANIFSVFEGDGPSLGLLKGFDDYNESFDEFLVLDGNPANPSVVYLDPGGIDYFYEEYFLDSLPASGTIYSFNRMSVSTDEIQELSTQFSVQPNPAKNTVRLITQMDYSDIQSVSIFNNNGLLMKNIEADYNNIDIEELAPGIYNMQIMTNEGLASKRFVKME